ncbi:MAG: right-handed parallel beta-helix repeat-containing protein [Desulfuromonadales bacterium]
MKTFFSVFIFLWFATFSQAADNAVSVYERVVLTEDTTWNGIVLVKGFVVVAPQATLRIDPGTVVRFAAAGDQQLPGMVIQGRIYAVGTQDKPITLTSDRQKPGRGSWGGIVLVSTEKRNILERCRIEYAETAIEVRFSSVNLKAITIEQAQTALLSHDGVVQMISSTVADSETGIEINNSEFDGKEITVSSCQRGLVLSKSAIALATFKILNNKQTGLDADECRIKISSGEFSDNMFGARIKGGEGQITMSRFQRNKQTALNLIGSRIKLQRCLFTDNSQDAVRTEDGQALLLNNAFKSNGGYNLYNAGLEPVNARLNWWGSTELSQIKQKVNDTARNKNSGVVKVFPWLNEKPPLLP